jgi:hypothetical protein
VQAKKLTIWQSFNGFELSISFLACIEHEVLIV